MKIGQFKLKMLFVLFAGFLLAAGCSESDSPEFEQSRRLVRNLYLAPVMSVYAGQTLTLQGVGFEAGDVVSFRSAAAALDMPVSDVTVKTARVVIPAAIARESYDVYVVRGAQEQYVATVKIYLTTDQEVPDKEGMNIKGIVFCGDKGVPGVRVSDGLQTVTTDENGYYWIPSLKTLGYVFITIPQGYLPAALDNNMMMGFWAGLTDEAGVCEKHNFELVEADTENHVMLVGADLHLADKQNDLRNFKNGFIAETQAFADASSVPVFCLMAGDMTWDRYWYDRNFRLPHYRQWLSRNGYSVPVFHAMGNHDMEVYGRSYETSFSKFEEMYGPVYYSFDVGRIHYVVLDDNFFIGRDYFYIGYLEERQMRWLEKDLARVQPGSTVVVCLHIPSTCEEQDRKQFRYDRAGSTMTNHRGLYEILKPYRAHIISGHTHTTFNQSIAPGLYEHVTPALSGAWWQGPLCTDGTPAGYGVYEVNGDRIDWYYKSTGYPADYQMKIYSGREYPQFEGYAVANVWASDPAWEVEFTIDGVPVGPAERFQAYDPAAKQLYSDTSQMDHKWIYPSISDHYYRVALPEGAKRVEVSATDRFGRISRAAVDLK